MRNPTNTRTFQAALLAMLALLAGPAMAYTGNQTVARLVEMSGSVLVSHASSIASAQDGLRLLPGTSVLTTANAAVIVEYDNGCRVKLQRNQRFVLEDKPCVALVESAGARPHAGRDS